MDPVSSTDPTWSSDDDEFHETKRLQRRSKKDTIMSVLADIPVAGWILNFIIGFIARKIDEVKRRRRSFKIGLYFQAQMVMGLVGFLVFFIYSLDDMSRLSDTSRVEVDCSLPSGSSLISGTLLEFYDDQGININYENIYQYVKSNRRSIPCTNENLSKIDAACSLADYICSSQLLLYLMLALAIAFLVSMVVCAIVFSGFNFFSNIPMESLDINVTSCKVTMFGTACKHGPWVQKVLNLVIIALVIALTLLPAVDSLCLGAMERTHSCVHMYDDCSLNQFRNCRYYYSDNCVGTGLPHASSQTTLFTKCKDPDFADRFSGRWDVRVVFPTACSRCWALDSDCKGPAVNSIRMTNNKTSPEFVYDPTRFSVSPAVPWEDLVLGQEIYCNCVEGIDKVGTSTGDAASLNFDPARLTRNNTQCSGYVAAGACPASLTATAGKAPFDVNATHWSEYYSDSAVGSTAKQTCDWAPQDYPGYYYEALECNQGGSVLNRFVFVSSYVTITLSVLLILAGLAVQTTVQSETWSYTPHRRDEPWYWRILRHVGPG